MQTGLCTIVPCGRDSCDDGCRQTTLSGEQTQSQRCSQAVCPMPPPPGVLQSQEEELASTCDDKMKNGTVPPTLPRAPVGKPSQLLSMRLLIPQHMPRPFSIIYHQGRGKRSLRKHTGSEGAQTHSHFQGALLGWILLTALRPGHVHMPRGTTVEIKPTTSTQKHGRRASCFGDHEVG